MWAGLRAGAVHGLGKYATVRLAAEGPAPVTVIVAGEIDLACADELAAVLRTALDAYPQGITLDLSSVSFCDCRGLNALLTARALARRRDQPFALGPCSPSVARLLDLANAHDTLTTPRRS